MVFVTDVIVGKLEDQIEPLLHLTYLKYGRGGRGSDAKFTVRAHASPACVVRS